MTRTAVARTSFRQPCLRHDIPVRVLSWLGSARGSSQSAWKRVTRLGGVDDVGPRGEDAVEQEIVDFGVWVGDAVGRDVEVVVAVGGVDDGGRTAPTVLMPETIRVVMPRSRSCWSRSVVDMPP